MKRRAVECGVCRVVLLILVWATNRSFAYEQRAPQAFAAIDQHDFAYSRCLTECTPIRF